MTTAIYHGSPGSFKSASLVQDVIVPALYAGRVVIHNIRGLNDLLLIEKVMEKPLPPEASFLLIEHDSQAGFDKIASFFHYAPFGALIVIDEAQRVYPKSDRKLDAYNLPDDSFKDLPIDRPKNVPEAFDRHRHFNWDIYLSTTNIAKIHPEVRLVCEWAYRLRNQSGLLPWYKNRYKVFRHDAESSGKSASHYDGTPASRTMDTKTFQLYKSTATGKTKGSSIQRSIFADPKLRLLGLFLFILVGLFFYKAAKVVQHYNNPHQKTAPISSDQISQVASVVRNDANNVGTIEAPHQVSVFVPFLKDKIYHVGSINNHNIFTIETDSQIVQLYDYELRRLGYKVKFIKQCFVELTIHDQQRFVFCPPHEVPKETNEGLAQALPAAIPATMPANL